MEAGVEGMMRATESQLRQLKKMVTYCNMDLGGGRNPEISAFPSYLH